MSFINVPVTKQDAELLRDAYRHAQFSDIDLPHNVKQALYRLLNAVDSAITVER